MRERILIAEADAELRETLEENLEDAGYRPLMAAEGSAALRHIERAQDMLDVLITDLHLPEMPGEQLLAAMRERRPEAPVIVLTADGSVEQAVEMVKAGVFQYLTRPFALADLLQTVEEALAQSAPQREQARLRREAPQTPARIIGASRPMRELFELIPLAAQSASTVLITGESGTGKELVARAIHELSGRAGKFIPINCAAIPADLLEAELFGYQAGAFTGARQARAGLFEAAAEGTLFLDEIGEMPLSFQPKLLRALQEGAVRRVGANMEHPVNVRIVAATNRDLEARVQEARFREDLFWRLNVIQLRVPPLRQRPLDIPLLVEHFISKAAEAAGKPVPDVSSEALTILTAYSWPGNVRELENAIERAVAFCQGATLTPDVLPKRVRADGRALTLIAQAADASLSLRELEREYILEILQRTGGNKKRAAELLGLDRKTLYRRLDEYRADDPALEV